MPGMRTLSLFAVYLVLSTASRAQPMAPDMGPVFRTDRLPTVEITLHPDTLAWILDPANVKSDREWTAQFAWDDGTVRQTVADIGFRLRGSAARETAEKAFKVSFNTFTPRRTWNGLDKMNLNGVAYDPSIIRSALAADLLRDARIPALRTNFVRFIVNGVYRGVYVNAEHVDENFTAAHFRDGSGTLFKCSLGASLEYLGEDPETYRSYDLRGRIAYEPKRGADFAPLIALMRTLEEAPDETFPESLEKVFDVNGFLRVLAFDILSGNWDGYAYNQNNFYLYLDPELGAFRYIPYDLDLTFGLTPFGEDWGTREIGTWTARSGRPLPRPLAMRVLDVEDYRNRLAFYLARMLDASFTTEVQNARIDAHYALIREAVEDARADAPFDPTWTYDEFNSSFEFALPSTYVEYGLKPFVSTRRTTALQQIEAVDVPPILSERRQAPRFARLSGSAEVRVWVEDEVTPASVTLTLEVDGERLAPEDMTAEGDGVYVATVGPFDKGVDVRYVIEAADAAGQTRQDPRAGWEAPAELATVSLDPTGLVVNELLASNDAAFADPAGEFDDWVELYNGASSPVSLAGLFFTDDLSEPGKFALPNTVIEAGAHVVLWADEDADQGPLHAPFKLSADGEDAALFAPDGAGGFDLIDSVTFGQQTTDVSYGRSSDGAPEFVSFDTPTPGSPNVLTSSTAGPELSDELVILSASPNPAWDRMTVRVSIARPATISADVVDLLGRTVGTIPARTRAAGEHRLDWQGMLASGIYAVVVTADMQDGTTLRRTTRLTVLR